MNITRFAIEKNRITAVVLILIIFGGWSAFNNLPQREDPGFIIRVAQVLTFFPGASPGRMENLVTDKIEEVVMEIPELNFVTSSSQTGLSQVYVEIKESYKEMRPIWDNLRRKVDRIRTDLPEGVVGPFVNDEFGDVFGIIMTITGEGYTYAELKDVADQVRDGLLRLPDAAKVEIYGEQEERIFVEYNNARLAQLGISPIQLKNILESQNILYPGGDVAVGPERIILEPTGSFMSLDELRRTIVNIPGRTDVLYLEDIAQIRRDYIDPPRTMMRSSGTRCLGLGISMREGGNIITLGEDVKALMAHLQEEYPIGIEFDMVFFQPDDVEKSVDDFVKNLLQAVVIVLIVMLLTLGFRTGLLVASLIPTTMLMAMLLMGPFGITLNIISLAALIISLGLLVDNAIVMSESIMVMIQEGKKPVEAAVESAKELRVPLLTSSLTTAAAFLPIYLAESSVGEYTADLFKVVTITLLSSWILSLTMIPMLCVYFVKVKQKKDETSYDSGYYRIYRGVLLSALKHRFVTLLIVVIIFFGAMQLAGLIPNIFFPRGGHSFLYADLTLPLGTTIDYTEAVADELEKYIADSLAVDEQREEGITNWATFVGGGNPRYILNANPNAYSENLIYMMFNTTSGEAVYPIQEKLEDYCYRTFPNMIPIVRAREYGPPVTAPIEIRLYGENEGKLFAIVDEVKSLLRDTPGTKNIDDSWGPREKKLVVNIKEAQARRSGITNQDIAVSLQTILSGLQTTEYREEDKIIPITLRAEAADRHDIGKLETLDVFSLSTGKTVPLSQVADIEVEWQPSMKIRRNRTKVVTVSSYVDEGRSAINMILEMEPKLDEMGKQWPLGYYYELGGELESSGDSQASISEKLPLAFGIIILLLVIQFNSLRKPVIILTTIPLALIGVFVGLVIAGSYMGFMTFLGVISLAGIVINNAIVLIDRIRIEQEEEGHEPRRAIIEAAQKRLRPILLTTATTIGGMMPLWVSGHNLFDSLAIAIIFGLLFSTVLTLGVVPVLYSLFYRVRFKGFHYK
ncbi:MAG: MMPL family transporter [candidate division Zixibacteria bacterium]|nr:MMPL family transporter [candidate division Zixibacteria bacterium]